MSIESKGNNNNRGATIMSEETRSDMPEKESNEETQTEDKEEDQPEEEQSESSEEQNEEVEVVSMLTSNKTELLLALVSAKQEFEVIEKNKVNSFFKSKYADLDSVNSAVDPALHANGLVVLQPVDIMSDGKPGIHTMLIHAPSGQFIDSWYPLLANNKQGQANAEQEKGKSITYARRYSKCAMLGVTAEEDTDGNNMSQQHKGNKERQQQRSNAFGEDTVPKKENRQDGSKQKQETQQNDADKTAAALEAERKTREWQERKVKKDAEKEAANGEVDTGGQEEKKEEIDPAEKLKAISRAAFHLCNFMGMDSDSWSGMCIERYGLKESRSEMTYENWKDWMEHIKSTMNDEQKAQYIVLGDIKKLCKPLGDKGIPQKDLQLYLHIRLATMKLGKTPKPDRVLKMLVGATTEKNFVAFSEKVAEAVAWVSAVGKSSRKPSHKDATDRKVGEADLVKLLAALDEVREKNPNKAEALITKFFELMQINSKNGVYSLTSIVPESMKEIVEEDEDGEATDIYTAWEKILKQVLDSVLNDGTAEY